jgi:hypothetical protein
MIRIVRLRTKTTEFYNNNNNNNFCMKAGRSHDRKQNGRIVFETERNNTAYLEVYDDETYKKAYVF